MGRFRSSSKNFFTLLLFAFAVVVLVVVVASVALRVEATLVFISVAQLTEVYFQSTFQLFSAFFSICFPSPSSLLVRVRHFFLSYRMQCEVGRGNP